MSQKRATDVAVDAIPGWLQDGDRRIFRWFLSTQASMGMSGDLAELGAYLGKSAVVIGDYLKDDETFTVVDLFGKGAADAANAAENEAEYQQLSQHEFERHYRTIHPGLPTIVCGYSHEVVMHVPVASHRFVHVDASHLFEHVLSDVEVARSIMAPEGIVVFDDIRSAHTPGVPAAIWPEISAGRLHGVLISDAKLYATFTEPEAWLDRLQQWLPDSGMSWEVQQVHGRRLYRVGKRPGDPSVIGARSGIRGIVPRRVLQATRRLLQ